MSQDKIKELLKNYSEGTLSQGEKAQIESWYLKQASESSYQISSIELDESSAFLKQALPLNQKRLQPRFLIAAAILVLLSIGFYFYPYQEKTEQTALLPGNNKAFLMLANGKKIALTDAKNEELKNQTGTSIVKTKDGQLLYEMDNQKKNIAKNNSNPEYHTVETPRGGQYQVILSDGSKVWLNAASSLKFPTSFAGLSNREVELFGEAYFEVTKDKQHPFQVKTTQQIVTVLGTHFNISAYTGNAGTQTTLLEGAVMVAGKSGTATLKPGEQSLLNSSGIHVRTINPNDALDWKNGFFIFHEEPLKEVMSKISRWYDVEIIYQNIDPDKHFEGSVSRYDQLPKLLHKIELTGNIHFKIEGRRILVMN